MNVDQFFTFLVCIVCGLGGGVIYDFCFLVRSFYPVRWVRIVTDSLFCLLFAALYLFVSVMMGLEGLRLYTFLGCLSGLLIYLKSFHKIVAFFSEKVYNGLNQARKEHRRWKSRASHRTR